MCSIERSINDIGFTVYIPGIWLRAQGAGLRVQGNPGPLDHVRDDRLRLGSTLFFGFSPPWC